MPKLLLQKVGASLVPANDDTFTVLEKLPNFDHLVTDFKWNRNPQNHRRFFAFLKATFDLQDHFQVREHYRKWIQMRAGHYTPMVTPKGATLFLPNSIAYEEMEEGEFQELFSSCINEFLATFGRGMDEQDLLRVIAYG